jgi:hypothetical protein
MRADRFSIHHLPVLAMLCVALVAPVRAQTPSKTLRVDAASALPWSALAPTVDSS